MFEVPERQCFEVPDHFNQVSDAMNVSGIYIYIYIYIYICDLRDTFMTSDIYIYAESKKVLLWHRCQ